MVGGRYQFQFDRKGREVATSPRLGAEPVAVCVSIRKGCTHAKARTGGVSPLCLRPFAPAPSRTRSSSPRGRVLACDGWVGLQAQPSQTFHQGVASEIAETIRKPFQALKSSKVSRDGTVPPRRYPGRDCRRERVSFVAFHAPCRVNIPATETNS